ncbi:MAG: type VI secretion system baseplate subunit TssE [Ancalomicrobiaceae bacterium]|nr:type VI secretion system baseplate subunit TssE [Ancalomicrobiaceae bacterium]
MGVRSLFERLEGARASNSGTDLIDSILANLAGILNSRAGCCETRPDLGMPDFNDLVGNFPNAIPIIARSVRAQIEAFEPRLKNVEVVHVPDPDRPIDLRFQITGWATIAGSTERISFDTVVGDDGHTFVR